MRQVFVVVAMVFAFSTGVQSEGSEFEYERPQMLTRAIICREVQSALSINAAFQRSAKAGWERLAIDTGRARRYYSDVRALNAHACLFKFIVEGRVVQKITVEQLTYYVLEDAFLRSTYLLHPKYAYRNSLGTIVAFEIEYNPPALANALK